MARKLCCVPDNRQGLKWKFFPEDTEVPMAERVIKGDEKILQLYKDYLDNACISVREAENLQETVRILEEGV